MEKYHRFSNPTEVDDWVRQYYTSDELVELGDNKSLALLLYKGNGYKCMNDCVRRGITNTNGGVHTEDLQQLLLSKSIKESIEVYRFVDFKELNLLLNGTTRRKLFEYPSFLSTTMLWKYYSMHEIKKGRFRVAIRIPKGAPGTYLPEINENRPEYEVLLPHHVKLRRVNCGTFEVVI